MNGQRGKRHYEAVLYFIIACVAIAVFYVWVMRLAGPAEQARIHYTLSNLRSAVQVAELTAIVAGKPDRLARLDRTNPFELMGTPPAAYGGILADVGQPRPGRWYFDAANGRLLYRLAGHEGRRAGFRQFQLRYRPADRPGRGPGRLQLTEVTRSGVSMETDSQ